MNNFKAIVMREDFFKAAALLVCGVTLTGCGAKVGTVQGEVTMDGKPLPNTTVTFVPDGGGTSASGTTTADGKFTVLPATGDGLPPGSYKVTVTTVPPAAKPAPEVDMNSPEYLAMASGVAMDSAKQKPFKETIPAKYNKATELKKEIVKGKDEVKLELSSK